MSDERNGQRIRRIEKNGEQIAWADLISFENVTNIVSRDHSDTSRLCLSVLRRLGTAASPALQTAINIRPNFLPESGAVRMDVWL